MMTHTSFFSHLTFILLFLLNLSSLAQGNYLPGYIIDLKGEKIEGFINYLNWENNPNAIYFSQTLESNKEKYLPQDIQEFGVADEKYLSEKVITETSPTKINELEFNKEFNFAEKHVFLQVLFEGPKSLYYYKGGINNTKNFFIHENGNFIFLRYKTYYKPGRISQNISNRRDFVTQLGNYLMDCSGIFTNIREAEYSKSGMEKVFEIYYKCKNSEPAFRKEVEKVKFRIGILGGASLTRLNFSTRTGGGLFQTLEDQSFSPSISPTVGVFADFVFPRVQRTISLKNELLLSTYQVSSSVDYLESNGTRTFYTTNFRFSYLKLNSLFHYRFPKRFFPMYVNAGMSNAFVIDFDHSIQKERISTQSQVIEEGNTLDPIRRYEQGLILGIGAYLNKFLVEGRYEIGNGISAYPALGSNTRRMYILAGYNF